MIHICSVHVCPWESCQSTHGKHDEQNEWAVRHNSVQARRWALWPNALAQSRRGRWLSWPALKHTFNMFGLGYRGCEAAAGCRQKINIRAKTASSVNWAAETSTNEFIKAEQMTRNSSEVYSDIKPMKRNTPVVNVPLLQLPSWNSSQVRSCMTSPVLQACFCVFTLCFRFPGAPANPNPV